MMVMNIEEDVQDQELENQELKMEGHRVLLFIRAN